MKRLRGHSKRMSFFKGERGFDQIVTNMRGRGFELNKDILHTILVRNQFRVFVNCYLFRNSTIVKVKILLKLVYDFL